MSEIVQFKRRGDAVIEDAEAFENSVMACVLDSQNKGVPGWMMVGKLMEVITDLHLNVTHEPEDGA